MENFNNDRDFEAVTDTNETGTGERRMQNEKSGHLNPVVREIISWIFTIAFAFALALFINGFIIVNANVPTGSMQNTIQPGDRLIGNRLAYLKEGPRRGDIIIFKYPVDESEIYIKRVIGLPGETLEIKKAKVYINGSSEPLKEDYLKDEWTVASDGLILTIPEDCYFVMGDNRNNSADGRYWPGEAVDNELATDFWDAVSKKYCFVKREKILGKALVRYFPHPKKFDAVEY